VKRFVEGEDRRQGILRPEYLDDYVGEDNPVRVIDVFVAELDLAALGFDGVVPAVTSRPAYHPSVLLKIYLYGYLNRRPYYRGFDNHGYCGSKSGPLTHSCYTTSRDTTLFFSVRKPSTNPAKGSSSPLRRKACNTANAASQTTAARFSKCAVLKWTLIAIPHSPARPSASRNGAFWFRAVGPGCSALAGRLAGADPTS
jgi:hypothetical protein